MEFRAWINNNSPLVTLVSVVLLILAAAYVIFKPGAGAVAPQPRDRFYYDLGSDARDPIDRLFRSRDADVPPIPAPSGKKMPNGAEAGVIAEVFACGDCSDRSRIFIGWLETYTKEARDRLLSGATEEEAPPALDPETGLPPAPDLIKESQGHLMGSVDEKGDTQWIAFLSPEGNLIKFKLEAQCPKGDRVRCQPDDVTGF